MAMKPLLAVAVATLPIVATGCAEIFYEKLPRGEFAGRLIVQWVEPNQFLYLPDSEAPLQYRASDGRLIVPKKMYTNAGSIPRLFWSSPGLGPWDFAPGYIIHDWIFRIHHCQIEDWQRYSFDDSARILAEAIKTQMQANKLQRPEPVLVWAIHEAVKSPIAEALWNKGECSAAVLPPVGQATTGAITICRIDFDDGNGSSCR
jgi:hypothetical protein